MKLDLVVAGYLIYQNKVLLIQHKKLHRWLPPGGHIEKNETPNEALKREFKEELNLDVQILNYELFPETKSIKHPLALPFYADIHSVGDHDHCCFSYLCIPKNPKELKPNTQELIDFGWFSEKELQREIIPLDVRYIAVKAFNKYLLVNKNA